MLQRAFPYWLSTPDGGSSCVHGVYGVLFMSDETSGQKIAELPW